MSCPYNSRITRAAVNIHMVSEKKTGSNQLRMKVWMGLLAALVLLQGGFVQAVNVETTVTLDKAFYRPGDVVTLAIQASEGARVQAAIRSLNATVATFFAPLVNGAVSLSWAPPALAPRGYGIDVEVLDSSGAVIAAVSGAFDVLERWIQAPRYGFLSDFQSGRSDIDETMRLAAQYHVNGLQFYDWQYRHETLLPPEGMEPYTDILGRTLSLETVKRLIDAAHERNIAAMPYTAIYGASYAFYEQHPDWALFALKDQPYDFAGFLKIMDPTPGSPWATHLLGEFANVLDNTAFDGIHIDQYGAPMHGRNAAGEYVGLEEAFPGFIDAAAALVDEKRGADGATIFNLVRNWPVKTVAPSDEDAVYIEVWDPYRYYMDLPRIIAQAQALGGGKPVIIAAYISPDHYENVRLANALIFASGAYHLELGEPRAMLADPYFPRYGLMSGATQELERRYYDFLVRYENVLALGTRDATADRAAALTIDGVETGTRRSQDRVAVIVRQGNDLPFETFSLVNLLGIEDGHWDVALAQGPTPLQDLTLSLQVAQPVTRVWAASPDGANPIAQAVDFSGDGSAITFTLPRLDVWTMIVVEYAS